MTCPDTMGSRHKKKCHGLSPSSLGKRHARGSLSLRGSQRVKRNPTGLNIREEDSDLADSASGKGRDSARPVFIAVLTTGVPLIVMKKFNRSQ